VKASLIYFELWFTDNDTDHRDQSQLNKLTIYYALKEIKESIEKHSTDTVIGCLLGDGFLHRDNEDFYNVLKTIEIESKNLGIKKIFLLVGMCHNYQPKLYERNIDMEIIEWNFPVNHVYHSYLDKPLYLWNSNSDKFLFLTGVSNRPNRIGLIKRLYDKNLLHKSGIWSFFPPWIDDDKSWCRNYCNDYTDGQYEKFLLDCENNFDNRYAEAKNYSKYNGKKLKEEKVFSTDFGKDMCFVNPNYYASTSISIISEGPGDGEQIDFFTEKLWRAIVNYHPFILAEDKHRYLYAKSLGLRTFEEYTNFDYLKDYSEEERLDRVVDGVIYFLNNCKANKEKIMNDIKHNKKIYNNIVENNLKIKNKLIDQFNVPQEDIDLHLGLPDCEKVVRIVDFVDV